MSDNELDKFCGPSKAESCEPVFTLSDVKSAFIVQLRKWAEFYNVPNYVKLS